MSTSRSIKQIAELIAAYVSRNALPIADLASTIQAVHAAFSQLHRVAPASNATGAYTGGSAVRALVGHERIVSFLAGRPYRTLKRHIAAHGLEPKRYRNRLGFPADYTMIAPSYTAVRSRIAHETQLGHKAA